MEQVFINSEMNDELHPGPHIGYAYDSKASYGELILEEDEYINEVSGSAN